MKLNQIWKKIINLNFRHKKPQFFPPKKALDQVQSWIWLLDHFKEAKRNHDEIVVDPLIEKLISKINELIGKYC